MVENKNIFSYILKDGTVAHSYYVGHCAKVVATKLFRRMLRETNEKTPSVSITIINLESQKKFHYQCFGILLDIPKVVNVSKHKYLTIRYDIVINKISNKMFE